MRLTELKPEFLKLDGSDGSILHHIDSIAEADGIIFKCPKCFAEKGSEIEVHSIICWRPRVPQSVPPTPGRWEFTGSGYDDLSLVAGSSSVALTSGCAAHFFVTNGEVRNV